VLDPAGGVIAEGRGRHLESERLPNERVALPALCRELQHAAPQLFASE
jgi:hypothetical protein